ncbi:MAG: hypothetical protein N4A47_06135 [Clostridia bacterium]|jgi:hypothetical protein|nr:hypothetical protein [Clostridia bacterium]
MSDKLFDEVDYEEKGAEINIVADGVSYTFSGFGKQSIGMLDYVTAAVNEGETNVILGDRFQSILTGNVDKKLTDEVEFFERVFEDNELEYYVREQKYKKVQLGTIENITFKGDVLNDLFCKGVRTFTKELPASEYEK